MRPEAFRHRRVLIFGLFLCICFLEPACGTKPTDLRTVIPGDALVYLEVNDLGKAVRAITENQKFRELARTQPDLSALDGISIAVAVTGFETNEEAINDQASILNFKPRFVAVAETNAWNFQANKFAEMQLGEFVNSVYGGDVQLEAAPKNGGRQYVWTARDGRKAFAFVQGSLIFFGNDESAIEKCLAVKRGEAESIASNPKVSPDAERLAFGFVPHDGVAQLANIAGASIAKSTSEEGEVQSFIARVLPELLRNSVTEITWTAVKAKEGIEDRYAVKLENETASALAEAIVPSGNGLGGLGELIPSNAMSVTRYDLNDPAAAWQSVLASIQRNTDATSGKLLAGFSDSLFEPYGIEEPQRFLESVVSPIITVRLDSEGEETAAIARLRNSGADTKNSAKELEKLVSRDIDLSHPAAESGDVVLFKSHDGETAAAFSSGRLIVGGAATVEKCVTAGGRNAGRFSERISNSNAPVVTFGTETDDAAKLVEFLAGRKSENSPLVQTYLTETRFDQNGMERMTRSDLGLLGVIIAQFGKE